VTLEESINANTVIAYVASKRLAEKAAFDFVEKNKPHFGILSPPTIFSYLDNLSLLKDIVTLCPPMVFGPVLRNTGDFSESST
jgi:hypothetical protein